MDSNQTDKLFRFTCLVIGQLLHLTSTFFWNEDGRHSVDASVLIILAMVFWAIGFIGLFDLLKEKLPWYSRIGLLYAFYGCLGGIAFGFEGLYSAIFDVSDKIGIEAYSKYPVHMNLVLFWAGPAFPLTLLVLGIVIAFKKVVPISIGAMMSMGAIAFPVSRIMRIQTVAHLADLLLLIPLIFLLAHAFQNRNARQITQQL
jgi:hypothetical protein